MGMTNNTYTETLDQIRAFIEKNHAAMIAQCKSPPDVDRMNLAQQNAYALGKADAYQHVLALLDPSRVAL